MNDLDQKKLREICLDPSQHFKHDGKVIVVVPIELLDRVTSCFDLDHLIRDPRGNRLPR